MSRPFKGPYPNPAHREQVALEAAPPLVEGLSGEVTASKSGLPLGVARFDGHVKAAYFSVLNSGKDDANTLSLELDVMINGTSIFSTKPKIAHVSGEANQQKTTYPEASDTGITAAVLNASAIEFNQGDVFTANLLMTRTASPTTEMSDPQVIVELMPDTQPV